MNSPGIGIGIIPRMSVTSVSVVTATIATGIGITSFTANWNAFSGAQYYLLDVSTSSSFSTFVYQDQVVLAPTTAYVVIGLTENTTYYYRLRASTDPFGDVDYLAFYNRVIAAGGTLTPTEQVATNQLVLDLKANNLWTPMKAIYPMVGASAAACAQNLKSSSFTGSFTSGWTFASTGVQGNGTSTYMDTFLSPNGNLSLNNNHISIYSRTNNQRDQVDMGIGDFGANASLYILMRTNFGIYHANNSSETNNNMTDYSDSRGFFINNRVSSSNMSLFRNNVKQTGNLTSVALSTRTIYIGAQSSDTVNPRLASNREWAFSSIGDGLLDAQASAFYTIVQNFQVALSRAV